MAKVTIESGENKGQIYDLQKVNVIGRSSTCAIRFNDVATSREHAKITKEVDGFYVHDLESHNGTLVNGEKISTRKLKKYDLITIGRTRLRFDDAEAPVKQTGVSPKQTEPKVQPPPEPEAKAPPATREALSEKAKAVERDPVGRKRVGPKGPSVLARIVQFLFLIIFFVVLILLSKWLGELAIDKMMQAEESGAASEEVERER